MLGGGGHTEFKIVCAAACDLAALVVCSCVRI